MDVEEHGPPQRRVSLWCVHAYLAVCECEVSYGTHLDDGELAGVVPWEGDDERSVFVVERDVFGVERHRRSVVW